MRYEPGVLHLVDQRILPHKESWIACDTLEKVAAAIEDMVVRGAPAIGCTAAFGLCVDLVAFAKDESATWESYEARFTTNCERLASTRPTAVNLFFAIDSMKKLVKAFRPSQTIAEVVELVTKHAQFLYDDDIATCKAIGDHGARMADGQKKRVLTHCNAGALATAGYGTAVGVIRSLYAQGLIELVYVDETRPYLQGARLTAFELEEAGIPYKLITDSVAAWLMQNSKVDWVVVGADRIASNGDTANKIGTYSLAVNCKHHDVQFYVAAPKTTFDMEIQSGKEIPVEERSEDEVKNWGGHLTAPANADVYNPSFDVTPAALINGIITESGVIQSPNLEKVTEHFK
jgi:methylthioribose-1-phosphate isomerase